MNGSRNDREDLTRWCRRWFLFRDDGGDDGGGGVAAFRGCGEIGGGRYGGNGGDGVGRLTGRELSKCQILDERQASLF